MSHTVFYKVIIHTFLGPVLFIVCHSTIKRFLLNLTQVWGHGLGSVWVVREWWAVLDLSAAFILKNI